MEDLPMSGQVFVSRYSPEGRNMKAVARERGRATLEIVSVDEIVANFVPVLGFHQIVQIRVDDVVTGQSAADDLEVPHAEIVRVVTNLIVLQEHVALDKTV